MQMPAIVSQQEWFEAHKAHLAREKALTQARDALSAQRRALPWMKLEKDYAFETTEGKKTLAGLFGGRSQLIIYHFMLTPRSRHRCPGCSFLADHIDGPNQHLKHHDVTVVVASRAPLSEILPFKRRMGWKFDWVSSGGSDFNYDFQVSFTREQIASGTVIYNFAEQLAGGEDWPGATVFYRNEHGDIFVTFMSRGRGGEDLIGAYNFLDMTPRGRNETGPGGNLTDWVRLHDEYNGPRGHGGCGG